MTRYAPPSVAELAKIEDVLADRWPRPHELWDDNDPELDGPPPLTEADAREADRLAKLKA
jgi:hypothetical protein